MTEVATAFRARYGPAAIVAGASEGLGEAFARELADRGFDLVLLARRKDRLDALAASLADKVNVRVAVVDLAAPAEELVAAFTDATRGWNVGLGVYNAAYSCIGEFHALPLADQVRTVDVNCRGPVVFTHHFGNEMAARGTGGLVLMSSLAGTQGVSLLASYAASKSFNTVLAEGLWAELRRRGVDIVASRAGATRTPNYLTSQPDGNGATMEPLAVVKDALAALGHGPTTVPGWRNKLAASFLAKVLPRNAAIRLMSSVTRKMYAKNRLPPTGK